ncbi:MAG: SDR family NAD(P)-dependent oxidoreductase [Ilumatobacteraceae bacterium]
MTSAFANGFGGRVAVVTGGGTGMGRELVLQLTADGCDVATCDVIKENLDETARLVESSGNKGALLTHIADVSDEAQVLAFRDAVARWRPAVNLLFNNAGIGGGGSFIHDSREGWERTFGVCFWGVYYNCRAFLDLVLAADAGHIINTSSVNGFWATIGPNVSHTSYSAAKFAVKGFTEALITDLRLNAPHVKASVVMPGHIGTSIVINSGKIQGADPKEMSADQLDVVRQRLSRQMRIDLSSVSDEDIRVGLIAQQEGFRDNAPVTAAEAAEVILAGVRNGEWRILVGEDAKVLDEEVRKNPWDAYEPSFVDVLHARGQFLNLVRPAEPQEG